VKNPSKELVFQNDIINQMVANGWQLVFCLSRKWRVAPVELAS
jgi:hypothetical protein